MFVRVVQTRQNGARGTLSRVNLTGDQVNVDKSLAADSGSKSKLSS
jgi:hypothetical protein